jgi:hypothetical protein
MMNDEEVYVTADGLGRAAIVRRADGLLCIHIHWIWPEIEEKIPVEVGLPTKHHPTFFTMTTTRGLACMERSKMLEGRYELSRDFQMLS